MYTLTSQSPHAHTGQQLYIIVKTTQPEDDHTVVQTCSWLLLNHDIK